MTFQDLGIISPILQALEEAGYQKPTPIQEKAIPMLLSQSDLLGCAQTGTGKTAAFGIPLIQQLATRKSTQKKRPVRGLILTPTRELALQISENLTAYARHTPVRNTPIFGGVKQGKQTAALKQGTDILVATPGRLLDLIGQGFISLKHIEYFVLDEADQMLDMGFIHDIRKLIRLLPEQRQSLFFSATMPTAIVKLAREILNDAERITIKPHQPTAERVNQSVYFVEKKDKIKLLKHLLKEEEEEMESVLVFSRTKHGADKIVRMLGKANLNAEAIHGNKSQAARQRALGNFKKGRTRVLVATDIASRGIDVDELSHVINYDLPNVPETYVHRIGRTGRAGASGEALSFCQTDERPYLKSIQKLIRQPVPVVEEHPFVGQHTPVEALTQPTSSGGGNKRGGYNRRKRRR